MTPRLALLAVLFLGSLPVGDALAQAVQLPTFHSFSAGTTVLVPDRGGAYLGGVNRAVSGSVHRGVPLLGKTPGLGRLGRNSTYGSTMSASGVGITATIIDHRELDAAVLAEAQALRGEGKAESGETRGESRTIERHKPVASVVDLEQQNARQDQESAQEVTALLEKGRQAEAGGKPSVAKIYYQMAARRAGGDLRRQVEAHLLELRAAELRLAKSRP